MKQPIQALMEIVGQAQAQFLANPGDSNSILMSILPDAVRAISELQAGIEADNRAKFVASHAINLLHTVIETTEDDDQLKEHARRAVRLSALVLDEAEKLFR